MAPYSSHRDVNTHPVVAPARAPITLILHRYVRLRPITPTMSQGSHVEWPSPVCRVFVCVCLVCLVCLFEALVSPYTLLHR